MSAHPTLSSENMDWQTPAWFLDLVRLVGEIDCDPCAAEHNPTGAKVTYDGRSAAWCGLAHPWLAQGLVFANPRYGKHLSGPVRPDPVSPRNGTGWAEKIASFDGEWLALVPVRTETAWWKRMLHACSECLLWSSPEYGSRIRFIHPETGKEGPQPNAASTVFYKGPRRVEFKHVFIDHGTLIRPLEWQIGRHG